MASVLQDVGELLVADRREDALTRAREALSGFERVADLRGQAVCLALLGELDLDEIESGKTIDRLERSLELLIESEGWFEAAAVALHLGEVHTSREELDRAEASLRQSLELLDRFAASGERLPEETYWVFAADLGLPPDFSLLVEPYSAATRSRLLRQAEGTIRDSLGSVLTWLDRFDEAGDELDRALGLMGPAEAEARALILGNLAILRQREGRFKEARTLVERLIRESADTPQRVKLFKLLEAFEIWAGDLEGALRRNESALGAARKRGDALAVAMLLKVRAELFERSGDLARAEMLYEEACNRAKEAGDDYANAQVLVGRAALALKTGRYEWAVGALEQAIPLLRSVGDRAAETTAQTLLGAGYFGLGANERGESAIQAALEIGRTTYNPVGRDMARAFEALRGWREGDADLDEVFKRSESAVDDPFIGWRVGRSQQTMMLVLRLFAAGAPREQVIETLGVAVQQAREDTDGQAEVQAHHLLGSLLRLEGQRVRAREELERGEKLARRLDLHHLDAQILGSLAHLSWDEGRRAEAVELALKAVEAFERTVAEVKADTLLTSLLGENTKVYTLAISGLIETGRFREAFLYSERARARALLQLLGSQRLGGHQREDAKAVAEMEEVRARLRVLQEATNADGSTSRELAEARRRFEDLLVRSQVVAPRYSELVRVAPLDLPELQAEVLGEDTALISFFVLGDRVVAWVVDPENLAFTPTSLLASDLDQLVCLAGRLVEEGRERGAERVGPCPSGADLATELYRELMAPVMPFVHRRKLVVVPHDALHRLPFAALRNPATGRYLIEDYTLTLVPSSSVLGVLRYQESSWTGRALVIGDPALPAADLGPLPGARREAEAVAALLGTEALLGKHATETRFRQEAAGAELIHVAAHGIYEPEHPLFSRIALAPDKHHDGRLEMHEVFGELDLSRANLVVLSGCRTALGESTGGDEVVGLIRAFLYAGTRGVLATLWSIDDEASAGFMESFYRRLLAGEPAAEALRQAQIETLRREGTAAPYYWAGFGLVGDPAVVFRQTTTASSGSREDSP